MYNDDFGFYTGFKYAEWEFVDQYNFKDQCTLINSNILTHYFQTKRFFDGIEFMDWAGEVIPLLQQIGYDVEVVSMGLPANLRLKYWWITTHLHGVGFIGVDSIKYHDKSHLDLRGGILLDDYADYLNTNADENICFGDEYSWNRNWNGKRLHNWMDVYKYLEKKGENK